MLAQVFNKNCFINNDNKSKEQTLRCICLLTAIMMVALLTTGCGKKQDKTDYIGEIRENTINLNEDGSIREIACQDFSDTTYDISGLKDEIKAQIEKYASGDKKDAVKLLQYKEENRLVRVAIDYASLADYNAFNGTSYAVTQDYMAYENEIMSDGADGEVNLYDIDFSSGEYKIFSADGDFNVNLGGQIVYYNKLVRLNSNSSARLDGSGKAIIIYK